ncbi:hypothetical protein [Nocardia sp. NPDC020380]|uniref:hypothetical protein n=1 Tax=Nocardia sp. NPDC020380 TaxID=3364309 RepID=UPI0037AAC1B8
MWNAPLEVPALRVTLEELAGLGISLLRGILGPIEYVLTREGWMAKFGRIDVLLEGVVEAMPCWNATAEDIKILAGAAVHAVWNPPSDEEGCWMFAEDRWSCWLWRPATPPGIACPGRRQGYAPSAGQSGPAVR